MTGRRWYLIHGQHRTTVAELSSRLSKAAVRDAAQAISTHINAPLEVMSGSPTDARLKVHANPTLVHHGYARRAAWHITGLSDQPIAELYFGTPTTARKIGHMLSDLLAMPLRMYENTEYGSPPLEQHNRMVVSARPEWVPKRNPSIRPKAGELWRTLEGGRCKVLSVAGDRVQVLHMESGNREWIQMGDFLASYRPIGRRNPKQKRRKRPLSRAQRTRPGRSGRARASGRGCLVAGARRAMSITARPGELRAFNAALLSQALPAEGLTNPRLTKKTVREGAAILLAAAGYATLAKEVRSGKIADPLEALRFARRGEHRPKAIEVLDKAIVIVAGVPERLRIQNPRRGANPKGRKKPWRVGGRTRYATRDEAMAAAARIHQRTGVFASVEYDGPGPIPNPKGREHGGRGKPRGRQNDPAPKSNPNMRVMYSPANRAWVWTFGDSLLRPAPDLPIFWDRRADLVSALDAIGIQTDKRGVTTSKPGMRLPQENRRGSRRKGRKSKGAGKARRNPRESAIARARRTYRHLNETEPGRVTKVKGARNAPKVAVKLGELVSIVYRSDKYAGSPDNPHGKQQLYEHRTKRPHPVIATDPEGREVHIVGGRMHPTPDGLVN